MQLCTSAEKKCLEQEETEFFSLPRGCWVLTLSHTLGRRLQSKILKQSKMVWVIDPERLIFATCANIFAIPDQSPLFLVARSHMLNRSNYQEQFGSLNFPFYVQFDILGYTLYIGLNYPPRGTCIQRYCYMMERL